MMKHDVVIIGAGLAGLRAALEIDAALDVAIVSKVHPLRSLSGTAQGGIAAVLNTAPNDSWESHVFDTIKAGDYLNDQDSVEIMARDAPSVIWQLERSGVSFDRDERGAIARRLFGGHSQPRVCHVKDRTGRAILNSLYGQLIGKKVKIYSEWLALALAVDNGACRGVVAYDLASGRLHRIGAKAVLLATGGCGRIFETTSNPLASTGDGMALAYQAGIPLQDMEFIQFHPTGLYQRGFLITESARSEGGHLLNGEGERFMERYDPVNKELATRDIIARAEQKEIDEGRGIDGNGYLFLDIRHLGKEKIERQLPQVCTLTRDFAGISCWSEPIPVQPTAHYMMGGIPVDNDGRVAGVNGLFAAGECACLSLHGANRLGSNSLLETLVFGQRAGRAINRYAKSSVLGRFPETIYENIEAKVRSLFKNSTGDTAAAARAALKESMSARCGIVRTAGALRKQLCTVAELKERCEKISIRDPGRIFNTALTEALELKNMLELAEVIVAGALARNESRGAHYRVDHPRRNDQDWLKHTLAYRTDSGPRLSYRPVRITKYGPASGAGEQ